ncbi:MAG: hypothetical protein GEV11_08720 [Streptosporangiales bacterium]|nr:hypothetical protein [Streptosporangiales bacterium]
MRAPGVGLGPVLTIAGGPLLGGLLAPIALRRGTEAVLFWRFLTGSAQTPFRVPLEAPAFGAVAFAAVAVGLWLSLRWTAARSLIAGSVVLFLAVLFSGALGGMTGFDGTLVLVIVALATGAGAGMMAGGGLRAAQEAGGAPIYRAVWAGACAAGLLLALRPVLRLAMISWAAGIGPYGLSAPLVAVGVVVIVWFAGRGVSPSVPAEVPRPVAARPWLIAALVIAVGLATFEFTGYQWGPVLDIVAALAVVAFCGLAAGVRASAGITAPALPIVVAPLLAGAMWAAGELAIAAAGLAGDPETAGRTPIFIAIVAALLGAAYAAASKRQAAPAVLGCVLIAAAAIWWLAVPAAPAGPAGFLAGTGAGAALLIAAVLRLRPPAAGALLVLAVAAIPAGRLAAYAVAGHITANTADPRPTAAEEPPALDLLRISGEPGPWLIITLVVATLAAVALARRILREAPAAAVDA